jgi:hypothetical protein
MAERGDPRSKAMIAECPDLTPYELLFWQAFGHLSTERDHGMARGPIPWSKVVAYARYHEMSRQETDILIRVIRTVDIAFLNATAAKAKKDNAHK